MHNVNWKLKNVKALFKYVPYECVDDFLVFPHIENQQTFYISNTN